MSLFNALLIIHIIGGGSGLLIGTYIMLIKKGGKKHKFWGNLYFLSMLLAALVAFPMSYLHPNYFLFVIAIFTCYMLLTGKRYINKTALTPVSPIDWALSIGMLLAAIYFIIFGIINLINKNNFGIVLLVFGVISLLFVLKDYTNYTGKSKIKNFGLTTHLQRMIGSYIASATAFLVVNNTILPQALAWLLPTAILVPLIFKWSRKYQVVPKVVVKQNA